MTIGSSRSGEYRHGGEKPRSVKASYLSVLPVLLIISLLLPFQVRLGSLNLNPHRVFLLVTFLPMLVHLVTSSRKLFFVDFLVLFSTLWAILAILVSVNIASAIEPAGLFLVEFFGAYLVARVCINSIDDFRRVIFCLFIALLFLTPLAILESVTHRPILLELLPNTPPPHFAGIRLGLRRAQVIFAHPILFGIFVSTCFGILAFSLKRRTRVLAIALSTLGSFASLSTGALASIVIQSGMMLWEIALKPFRLRWRFFAGFCFVTYVLIDLLSNRSPVHVLVSYATFSSQSAYGRILIWDYGTENVLANPWFGLGENIEAWSRPSWMGASVDNFWLLMAMKYGLPMLLALALAIALIIRMLSRAPLLTAEEKRARAGLLISIGGIVIAGGTVHLWNSMMSFIMFVLGSGLWVVAGASTSDEHEEAISPSPNNLARRNPYTRFPS